MILCASAQFRPGSWVGGGPFSTPQLPRANPAQRSPRRRLTFPGRVPLAWLAVIFRQGLFALLCDASEAHGELGRD